MTDEKWAWFKNDQQYLECIDRVNACSVTDTALHTEKKCEASLKEEEIVYKTVEDRKLQGHSITSLGAILVIVCFFLPWTHGCSGYEYARMGIGAIKGGNAPSIEDLLLLVIPTLGIISLVLIWVIRQGGLLSLLSAIGGIISLLILY